MKIGNYTVQPGAVPNLSRRPAISDIEKSSLKLINFTKQLLNQEINDENSFSNGLHKSEGSESGSESESNQGTEPLKWSELGKLFWNLQQKSFILENNEQQFEH